jgi:hypothetical protein
MMARGSGPYTISRNLEALRAILEDGGGAGSWLSSSSASRARPSCKQREGAHARCPSSIMSSATAPLQCTSGVDVGMQSPVAVEVDSPSSGEPSADVSGEGRAGAQQSWGGDRNQERKGQLMQRTRMMWPRQSVRTGAPDLLEQGRGLVSGASSRHALAANEGSLECKFCWDWLADHEVVRLDCAGRHSFCLSCVVRWFRPSLQIGERRCPYCIQECYRLGWQTTARGPTSRGQRASCVVAGPAAVWGRWERPMGRGRRRDRRTRHARTGSVGLMEWPRLSESESEDETALPHASPRQMVDTRAAMQEQGVNLRTRGFRGRRGLFAT